MTGRRASDGEGCGGRPVTALTPDDRLATICVPEGATIRDAMVAIDRGGVEIALVVDAGGRLLGTVSDGDVRRALLGGAGLDEPVEPLSNKGFRWVPMEAGRAEVLDLMQACAISQVPALGRDGRVRALHLLREIVGAAPRDTVAVVMAGGQGVRLRPLTDSVPKPMIRVAGRPILERIVLHLVGSGIRSVYLAVNYRGEAIEAHFGDGRQFGCRIEYLREDADNPLGTAGALSLLPQDLRHPGAVLLVMNGDLVTQFDVDGLIRAHERSGAVATMGVRPYVHEVPFGVVDVDGGVVQSIEEKPRCSWLVNAGVYAIDGALAAGVDAGQHVAMTDLLLSAVRRGERVASFLIDAEWQDVGRQEELRRARGEHL